MILLVGAAKGGCGKSTIAVNIAAFLSKQNDVILVDADRQTTASNWAVDREESKADAIQCIQKYTNINATLLDFDEKYDHVIVDVAGHDSEEMRTTAAVAHKIIIPIKPSQPDLDAFPKVVDVVEGARKMNPSLSALAVINMAASNPRVNEHKQAQEYIAQYPEIQLLDTIIRDRKVYRDAMAEGLGVIEMGNKKAKVEIELLMKEII